jgi:hypothetical protein
MEDDTRPHKHRKFLPGLWCSCRDLCRYATLEELVEYFDEFDQRKIGRRNVIAIAELLMKWDTDGDGKLSYPELDAYYPELSNVKLSMTPSEIHLQLVDDNNIMVMWVTQYLTDTTTVMYGTVNGSLTQSATGTTHTYTAGGWKGVIHQVCRTCWRTSFACCRLSFDLASTCCCTCIVSTLTCIQHARITTAVCVGDVLDRSCWTTWSRRRGTTIKQAIQLRDSALCTHS